MKFKSARFFWHPFRSILCRVLMISYTIWLNLESYVILNDPLIYLNLSFLVLIVIDGVQVFSLRKGLEDRWCSLSILFFICANSVPFWLLEINASLVSTKRVLNPDREPFYRELANSHIFVDASQPAIEQEWSARFNSSKYLSILSKHEAFFCLVLIFARVLIPQATLTWAEISNQSEFAFNTIFDIYSTLTLIRDPRNNLDKSIWIMTFVVCNGALYPIALNVFPDSSSSGPRFATSRLRRITDSPYFRLVLQIVFADLPFLLLRLIILNKLKYVRREMYYLIAKQMIIIICKISIMAYDWFARFFHQFISEQTRRLNESTVEWKINKDI